VTAGAGAYFVYGRAEQPAASETSTVKKTGQDVTFAPRFTQISAYTKYQNAEWYAAPGAVIQIKAGAKPVYFGQKDGLPAGSQTALVVYHDKLWLSSQNGTAVLKSDGSGFTEVPVQGKTSGQEGSIQNGKLHYDAQGDALYLSTFTDFFAYNEKAAAWEAVKGTRPIDAQTFASNKDFIVANANSAGSPVWVYSKKAGAWNLNRVPDTGDGFGSAFAMGEDLFFMTRSKGYSGCSDAGKAAASVVYHLSAAGTWQPITKFNSDKARPELLLGQHVKNPETSVYTSQCGEGEKTKIYTLAYAGGELSLTNERPGAEGIGGILGDDGEQQAVVDELSKVTHLYPFTRALAVDKAGNVVFAYSKAADYSSITPDAGLAVAKGSDLTDSKTIEIQGLKRYDTVRPVMCGGQLQYVFLGEPEATEGGPSDKWTSAKLLKVNGSKTSAFADLGTDMTEPAFSCTGQTVSWLGHDGVKQLNTASKKIVLVGPQLGANLSMTTGQAYPLENGGMWLVTNSETAAGPAPGTLYYFDSAKAAVTKLAVVPNNPKIMSASATNIWIAGDTGAYRKELAMYNQQGTKVYAKQVVTPLVVTATGNSTASMASGTVEGQTFTPVNFANIDAAGTLAAISADSVVMHSLYDHAEPGGPRPGIYDAKRQRVWVTDSYFGLFAVPVQTK
jgi:hypothetical protein